jgi:ribosomal-protein-alanine N-acetyltransferase
MDIKLRPAEIADIPQIISIEDVSFSNPWSKVSFLSELVFRGYNYSVVAVDEVLDEVVGYCFFWLIEDDEIHITNIAVNQNRRQQWIGKGLIEFVVTLAREHSIPSITLEVRDSNTAAKAFYERLGFEQAGRRKDYYEHPREDALVLRLKLSDN